MTQPIVTVVLATYNGARFLPEQLRSLACQTRRPDRLVLRDDGSSDDSVEVVRRWAESAAMPLQVVTTGQRLGPAQSFLQALKAAAPADIFMLADQDDVWLPLKIESALGFVLWGPEAPPMLYASRLVVVDEQLRMTGVTPRPTELSFNSAACESVLTGCTMALNSSFRERIVQAIPQHAAMHDWWLYLLATSSATLVFDDTPTVLYRQHAHNVVGAAASGWVRIRERVARFVGPNSRARSRQLQEFLDLHGPHLSPPTLSFLHQILSARHSLAARLKAALLAPVRRQSFASRLSTRFALLVNRF